MDSATAAATVIVVADEEEDNESNDNYPGAVVVKKIAKTAVVHKFSPFERVFIPPRYHDMSVF